MNAPATALAVTEAQRIEAALDLVLAAAISADRNLKPLSPERGPVAAGIVAYEVIDRMANWTSAQGAANDLLDRPVSELCRQAVTTFGERLYEIGGLTLMQDTLYRVSEMDPLNSGRRMSIMDHRWDGIGRTDKLAGWCS